MVGALGADCGEWCGAQAGQWCRRARFAGL